MRVELAGASAISRRANSLWEQSVPQHEEFVFRRKITLKLDHCSPRASIRSKTNIYFGLLLWGASQTNNMCAATHQYHIITRMLQISDQRLEEYDNEQINRSYFRAHFCSNGGCFFLCICGGNIDVWRLMFCRCIKRSQISKELNRSHSLEGGRFSLYLSFF